MKNKFEKLSNVGKNAKEFVEKSKYTLVKTVDQNNDGKFDIKDVSVIAGNVKDIVQKNAQTIKETVDTKVSEMELKVLQPVFLETFNSQDFFVPKFIKISGRDKRYAENDSCKKSIGYLSNPKGIRLLNIFRDSVEASGLSFYPDYGGEFYYMDPSDSKKYIVLEEYFNYLKQVRINELQMVAQDLGAKHFRVTYMEENRSFLGKKATKGVNLHKVINTELDQSSIEKKYVTAEIAAEMEFLGHAPKMPKLQYMKYDPSINGLIEMRMKEYPLVHQKFMLKLSNTSGLKESEALRIDATLKSMKVGSNMTILKEAQNESKRYLEYEIDF